MPVINQRLRTVQRLWIIEQGRWQNPPSTLDLDPDFRPAGQWRAGDFTMQLSRRVEQP